jgi:hypothetical protein
MYQAMRALAIAWLSDAGGGSVAKSDCGGGTTAGTFFE